jgi:hypothetical protein
MCSLARVLLSPDSAEDQRLFVRLVHRYYGAVRLLRSVRVRGAAFGLWPRSLSGRGAPEVSRFSCMLFLGMHSIENGPRQQTAMRWRLGCGIARRFRAENRRW